jgi:hypothetical protein
MKAWSMQTPLETQSSTSAPEVPKVALNAQGSGAAVWFSIDVNSGRPPTLHARTFSPQNGFSRDSTVTIDQATIGFALVALPNGDTVVMYGAPTEVVARTLSAGQWSAPTMLSADSSVSQVDAVVDDDGNITCVWSTGFGLSLFASRNFGSGWSAPAMLGIGGPVSLALDSGGNVSLVSSKQPQAFLRRIAKTGQAWTDPVTFTDTDPGNLTAAPAVVAHDASDNPMVVYAVGVTGAMGQSEVHVHWRICR